MKIATLKTGGRGGTLVIVNRDFSFVVEDPRSRGSL